LNAPLSQTHPNCVKLALQQERLRTAELQKKINKMENEIKVAGVEIDDELCSGLFAIMADNEQKVSPFMKLFWEQQTKLMLYVDHQNSGRWKKKKPYPMMKAMPCKKF